MNKLHNGVHGAANNHSAQDGLNQAEAAILGSFQPLWENSQPVWDAAKGGSFKLTKGVDHVVAPKGEIYTITGVMGFVQANGQEAFGTWNTGDTIIGNGADTTLELVQNKVNSLPGSQYDLAPLGVTVEKVGTIKIDSVQALGGYYGNVLQIFDLSTSNSSHNTFISLGAIDVANSFGDDYIKANTTTALNVFDSGGNVTTYGGYNVDVSTYGTVSASGALMDTNVTVGGFINGLLQNPVGSVTVTDTGYYNGADTVSSGASVVVNGTAQTTDVTVHLVDGQWGEGGDSVSNVLIQSVVGNVVVDGGAGVSAAANVTVIGGADVNILASGDVVVGGINPVTGLFEGPSGPVVVDDTGLGSSVFVTVTSSNDPSVTVTALGYVDVQGDSHNVTVNQGSSADVTIGVPGGDAGGLDPNGTIIVNDASTGVGSGLVSIETNGATEVDITGGTANGIIDFGTVNDYEGALTTVSLTDVTGTEVVVDNALSTLTVASELAPFAVLVADGGEQTLNLNLNNDGATNGDGLVNAPITVEDDATLSVAITMGGNAGLYLGAAEAQSLTVDGNGVLSLARGDVGLPGTFDPLQSLQSITLTQAAGLNDGSYALFGNGSELGVADPLAGYSSLTTINASGSTGAVTVGLNSHETFTGGAGLDIVTLSEDQLVKVTGGSDSAGGVSANILIVDALATTFTHNNTGLNVSGFGTLQTNDNSGGTYDLENVFNNIANLVVSQGPSTSETFSNAGAAINMSVDASTGADQLALISDGLFSKGSLNLTLGVAGAYATSGIDVANSTGGVLGAQTLLVSGPYQNVTVNTVGTGEGVNLARVDDASITTLTLTGNESLTLGSPIGENANHSHLTVINNDATSGTINLASVVGSAFQGLVGSSNGVTLTSASGASVDFTGFAQSIRFDTVNLGSPNVNAYENNVLTESGTGGLVVDEAAGSTLLQGSNLITSAQGVLDVVLSTAGGGAYNDTATDTVVGNGPSANVYLGDGNYDAVTLTAVNTNTNAIVSMGNGYGDTAVLDSVNAGASATVTVGNGNEDAVTLFAGTASITYGSGLGDVINLGEAGHAVSTTVTASGGAGNDGSVTINFLADAGTNTLNIASGASAFTVVNGAGQNGNTTITGGGSTNIALGTGSEAITLSGAGNNTIALGATNPLGFTSGNDVVSVGTGSNDITLGQNFGATASVTVGLHAAGADSMTFLGVTGQAVSGTNFSGISLTGLGTGDTLNFSAYAGGLVWNGDGTAAGAQIEEPKNATLQDYLNVATQLGNANNGVVSWFTLGTGASEQTYIVEERSATGGNFANGTDQVIQLTGNQSALLLGASLSGNTIHL